MIELTDDQLQALDLARASGLWAGAAKWGGPQPSRSFAGARRADLVLYGVPDPPPRNELRPLISPQDAVDVGRCQGPSIWLVWSLV